MIDGGPGAAPGGRLDAWLVTDEHAELITDLRRLAGRWGLVPRAATFRRDGLSIVRRPVVHTSHPTYGYRIETTARIVVWAPEFLVFPRWAREADLMFAEAAGWDRPIRFARGVGGHLDAVHVARCARNLGVRRLVFAHIGRPTLRALDRGEQPPFGEFAIDGQRFVVATGRHDGGPSSRGLGRRRPGCGAPPVCKTSKLLDLDPASRVHTLIGC
jgi:hypothetical protein